MPGRFWSMPKSGWPVTTFRLSTPPILDPSSVKSLGSLSATDSAAGTGSVDAFATKSPNFMDRPEAAWRTTPASAMHSFAGTPHVWAAASTSIARAVAPTLRIAVYDMGVDMLPPANWGPNAGSSTADTTRTFFQSAPSSSATIIGSDVLIPWPTSGRAEKTVTVPSGAIRMNALGMKTPSTFSMSGFATSAAPAGRI